MLLKNDKLGKQAEIEIRLFKRGDEKQFKECISDFYGDGYPYKEYFEEGFVADLCEAGKLYLLCAFSADGEMAGTVGARLSDAFPGSAIMCLRVVKKKFQGLGIASIQRTMLLEHLKNRTDIRSIYVDALAHDKFSQEDLQQFGFVTSGVRLQLYKADVMIPYGGYSDSDRISQTIMCRAHGEQDAGEFFCPKEHEEYISDFYKKLGVKYKLTEGKKADENKATKIDEHFDENHNSATVIIRRAGTDFSKIFEQHFENIEKYDVKSIICYVNLSAAGAKFAYEYLKSHDFFFSGLKPLNTDGEYILMTWVKDGEIRRHLINACDDGNELLLHIENKRSTK